MSSFYYSSMSLLISLANSSSSSSSLCCPLITPSYIFYLILLFSIRSFLSYNADSIFNDAPYIGSLMRLYVRPPKILTNGFFCLFPLSLLSLLLYYYNVWLWVFNWSPLSPHETRQARKKRDESWLVTKDEIFVSISWSTNPPKCENDTGILYIGLYLTRNDDVLSFMPSLSWVVSSGPVNFALLDTPSINPSKRGIAHCDVNIFYIYPFIDFTIPIILALGSRCNAWSAIRDPNYSSIICIHTESSNSFSISLPWSAFPILRNSTIEYLGK